MALARVWTLDGAEGVLQLQASAGLYTGPSGPLNRVPIGEKIGHLVQNRRPYVTNDLPGDPNFGSREWAGQEGLVACINYIRPPRR